MSSFAFALGLLVAAPFAAQASQDPFPSGSYAHPSDPHWGGRADVLRIAEVLWGRSVDVYGLDASGTPALVLRDFVIGPDFQGAGAGWRLETQTLLGPDELIVQHAGGSPAFLEVLAELEAGLVPVHRLEPGAVPLPERDVPSNATLVVRFDDLLDRESVGPDSVRLLVGGASDEPEPYGARVLADPNHGGLVDADGDGVAELHPTRVLIDPALSLVDRQRAGGADATDGMGLPAAVVLLQVRGLRNLAGASLGAGAGATPAAGGGHSLSFRSGGGVLADIVPPYLIGVQPALLSQVTPLPGGLFLVDFRFGTASCAQAPRRRDVLLTPDHVAVVGTGGTLSGATVTGMRVFLLAGNPATFVAGPGQFASPFDAAVDAPECFVSFSPEPGAPPAAQVQPASQVLVYFSEQMNASSVRPFDTFTIERVPGTPLPTNLVVGTVTSDFDEQRFLFTQELPLAHAAGAAEPYFVTVAGGLDGVTDKAGNALANPLPPEVPFTLDPGAAAVDSAGFVLRFHQVDEDLDGAPEVRGQFTYDLIAERIDPRPVTRFAATADRTQVVPGIMFPLPVGVQNPLNPMGSKLMQIWRYVDFGQSALDESFDNIDIEGLAWAPFGGQVVADSFPEFEISLSHSHYLPDEHLNPASILPSYPQSGLQKSTFDINVLQDPASPQTVVHPKALGYSINPIDLFVSSTGTTLFPYPLNSGTDPSTFSYYTWRDTAIQAKAAPNGVGIDLQVMEDVGLIPSGTSGSIAPVGEVPSIGLPLLMEYKCYPTSTAIGLNAFDVSIAINSSRLPAFRVFSAGGVDAGGQTILVDPDLEVVPSGGITPTGPTPPDDNTFTIGQADMITRVSRVHSVWIDTSAVGGASDFFDPVVEPAAPDQPNDTEVVLAFRGADSVPLEGFDATQLDRYGELPVPLTVVFFGGDDSWKSSIDDVDGARYLQVRFTFVGNTATQQAASLDSFGVAFLR
ncbi:MAG: Ig-like domain-containing protein [Planctomycetota bacterium]|nr:Ig-like domain-containing protein [Planctomycetota bacterium]